LAFVGAATSCVVPRDAHETAHAGALPATPPPTAVEPPAGEPPGEPVVVVVVLDGARWQEVFVGADPRLSAEAGVPAVHADALMPNLHALVAEHGAALGAPGHGTPIAASGPNFVSLPGYTEIFTGRRTHDCADNDCAPAHAPTVVDEIRAVSSRPSDVAVIASWPKIARAASADPERIVLSAGRARTAHAEAFRGDEGMRDVLERGAQADPYPGYGEYRPDRFTAALGLRYLELERPRFLFLGLGEPDEYAHRDDYAGYLGSMRACDAVLGELFAVLRRMGTRGEHTTVLVTADHGRGRDYRVHGRAFPESARVWLVAAGRGIEARGFARASRPHRLADVAPTVRALLDLPADATPAAGAPLDELLAPAPVRTATLP
ncbi:MAG TPA: alkaline phosphatase family protein, partial [Polyangiaceae bacterium]|nr:alkaline phosphatase family protein [Polyangiaceae bacterium]